MKDEIIRPSDAAEVVGRHVDTLKRWDREGVFEARRDSHGWTYYTPADLERLKQIAAERGRP